MIAELSVISLIALIVLYAYKKGKIDLSAVAMTAVVGFSTFLLGGLRWIILLLLFFVFGNIASHYKKKYKRKLGCEQSVRTWINVFGNGGAALIFAVLNWLIPNPAWFLAMCSSMVCATADTFATEIGQAHGRNPRMIHTLKKANPGVPGAVSKEGFLAAGFGALLLSVPLLIWGYSIGIFLLVIVCGFIGMILDSFMGATIEKRKIIDTHQINFITTFLSGILFLILMKF